MEWLFGKKKTPAQMMRQQQRALQKAMRNLDREKQTLENQETKLKADIKKMAKQGQMGAVKVMAKDIVRNRSYVTKFVMMKANIQAISLKLQTIQSQAAMADAMKGVTKAMGQMNKTMKLPQIQQIMRDFEKESEIMDMKQEMITDTIDDAMATDEDEEETDALVNQVLGELGLEDLDKMGALPTAGKDTAAAETAGPTAVAAGEGDVDDDLEKRLNNLKRT